MTVIVIFSLSRLIFRDDDEEIDEAAKSTAPITSFFVQKTAPDTINRSRFFVERKLQQVYDF